MSESTQVSRDPVGQAESTRAQRYWWDREAADYYTEHGAFLGDAEFVWVPEGWTEAEPTLEEVVIARLRAAADHREAA